MAIDMTATRTRRGILAGVVGGVAAWAASAVGRTLPVRADNDNPVILGQDNTETKPTRILTSGTGDSASAFEAWDAGETYGGGFARGDGGVSGENDNPGGLGVWGRSTGGGTGVLGWSQLLGTEFGIAIPVKTGVYGRAIQDSTSVGVLGETNAGHGVRGTATGGSGVRGIATTGTGVYAITTSGYALRTSGRVRVDKASGSATITAGHASVTVTPGLDVTSASFVLLTPKSDPGTRRLWYTKDTTANTITIKVSSAVSTSLSVGWLLLG